MSTSGKATQSAAHLVVGGGLAGCLLAHQLEALGQRVLLTDDPTLPKASAGAAGLFNPITGREMKKTWLADELFPFLLDFYPALERKLAATFFFPRPIFRPFVSVAEQNDWAAKAEEPAWSRFVKAVPAAPDDQVKAPLGGLLLSGSGYVELPSLISATHAYFAKKGQFWPVCVDVQQLLEERTQHWHGHALQKIVLCQGTAALQGPFGHLRFRPNKGQVLHVSAPKFETYIPNRGVFVVTKERHTVLGATYERDFDHGEPTAAGHGKLLEKASGLLQAAPQVEGSWAGVRPATYDRRPFLGWHPQWPQLGLFNGLGSKGVSLGPYFAEHMAQSAVKGTAVRSEVSILRGA